MESSIISLSNHHHHHQPSSISALLILVIIFAAFTGLLLGFDLSVVAVILNPLQEEYQICSPKVFSCFKRELFVAIIAPGALIGSVGGGIVADYFGRRVALVFSDIFFVAGSLFFYFSTTWGHILSGRLLIGVGIGIGFVVFSTYVSEIAPAESRGRLMLTQEVAQCVGVLSTYVVATLVGDEHWRALLSAGGVAAVIQLVGVCFLPESPRWLLLQGRRLKAISVMKALGISDSELPPPEEEEEYDELDASQSILTRLTADVTARSSVSSKSFQKKHWMADLVASKKEVAIACFVGVAQNMLCTNAALYFSTDLFLAAGVCKPYEWGIGLGLMKLFGTIIVFALVDKVGRRLLLSIGTFLLSVVFALMAFSYSLVPEKDFTKAAMFCQTAAGSQLSPTGLSGTYSILVALAMLALVFSWELSWAGLMYVVAAEIMPSSIRGIGMGLVINYYHWWVGGGFAPSMSHVLFLGTFIGLCLVSYIILGSTYLFVPDMTGQSLEMIHRMLTKDRTERQFSLNSSRDGEEQRHLASAF